MTTSQYSCAQNKLNDIVGGEEPVSDLSNALVAHGDILTVMLQYLAENLTWKVGVIKRAKGDCNEIFKNNCPLAIKYMIILLTSSMKQVSYWFRTCASSQKKVTLNED